MRSFGKNTTQKRLAKGIERRDGVKQKSKRNPRGKMKPVVSEMTEVAEAVQFLKEFGGADDAPMMKALRDVEDSWVAPELLKAAKRGELAEVVRAIKRLPKETDSQCHVRLAHLSLCYGSPPFPTF